MDASWMPPAIVFAVWLAAVSLQFADIGTARFDARQLARGTQTVVRLHAVAWVVPVSAIFVVGLGLGLHWLARLVFVEGDALTAIVAAAILVAGSAAAWLIVTAAATRPAADSYRAIRDELVDVAGTRVQQERLEGMRARLSAIDADRTEPPSGSAIGWVVRRPQRLAAILIAVALLVLVIVAAAGDAAHAWLVVGAIAAVGLSTSLSVGGARASLLLIGAVRDAQVEYRAEALHLLTEAEKSSKKPVAGLGDRVTRALQILREQQG